MLAMTLDTLKAFHFTRPRLGFSCARRCPIRRDSMRFPASVFLLTIVSLCGCGSRPPAVPITPEERLFFCPGSDENYAPSSERATALQADTAPRSTDAGAPKGTLLGTISLHCALTKEGALKNCCIRSGIAGHNAKVFNAVKNWRYKPVIFPGMGPVEIPDYYVNVRVVD